MSNYDGFGTLMKSVGVKNLNFHLLRSFLSLSYLDFFRAFSHIDYILRRVIKPWQISWDRLARRIALLLVGKTEEYTDRAHSLPVERNTLLSSPLVNILEKVQSINCRWGIGTIATRRAVGVSFYCYNA